MVAISVLRTTAQTEKATRSKTKQTPSCGAASGEGGALLEVEGGLLLLNHWNLRRRMDSCITCIIKYQLKRQKRLVKEARHQSTFCGVLLILNPEEANSSIKKWIRAAVILGPYRRDGA